MSRNLLPLSVAAALLSGAAVADVPRVAVDIAPVHSLVSRVMQGVGEPSLIVAPGGSPHEYNLRPSEAAALQDADLVFWIGPDLTPWLDGAIGTLAGTATRIELFGVDGTIRLPTRESALFEAHHHEGEEHEDHAGHGHDDHDHDDHDHDDHDHDDHDHDAQDHDDHRHDGHDEHAHDHEEHDHEEVHHVDDHAGHGHEHGAHDPHAWLSPDNGAVWLNAIAAQLSVADPENAGTYFANAAAGREDLETLKTEINTLLEPVRGNGYIVFHDAYQYFEHAFDVPASGAISVSDATDPSPARIAEIQARVEEQGVTCVLSEPQFSPGMVSAVMEGSDVRTGVLDPLGANLEPGAELYGQVLRDLASTLADCL